MRNHERTIIAVEAVRPDEYEWQNTLDAFSERTGADFWALETVQDVGMVDSPLYPQNGRIWIAVAPTRADARGWATQLAELGIDVRILADEYVD